jgi:hypothetical protein
VVRVGVTGLAAWLIFRKIGIHPILHALSAADPRWLAAGYGLAALSILITVAQWCGLLRAGGLRRGFGRCLHLELAGDVFDAALPSSIGGDFVRATSVGDGPGEVVVGASSVLLRRLCNFPGMIVLLALGLIGSLGLPYAGRLRPYGLGALGGGVVLVLLLVSPAFGRMAGWKLLRRGPGPKVAQLLGALHDFRGRRSNLVAAMLRGLAFWCVVVASQAAFMRAVGIHVPLGYAAAVVATTTAVTMLPISLGGYGLREGAFAAFLSVGGLATGAQGAAVGVCITVQTLALGVVGIPFYLTARRRRKVPAHRVGAPGRRGAADRRGTTDPTGSLARRGS